MTLIQSGSKFELRDINANTPFSLIPVTTTESNIEFPSLPQRTLDLSQSLKSLLNNPLHSDVLLRPSTSNNSNNDNNNNNNAEGVYGHRCIIATRCPQLLQGIADDSSSPASLPIQGVSHQSLLLLLEYIYTGDIAAIANIIQSLDNQQSGIQLELVFELLPLSERFGLKQLERLCQGVIERVMVQRNVFTEELIPLLDVVKKKEKENESSPNPFVQFCSQYILKQFNSLVSPFISYSFILYSFLKCYPIDSNDSI